MVSGGGGYHSQRSVAMYLRGGGILDAARDVRFVEAKAGALPFSAHPVLQTHHAVQRLDRHPARVHDAELGHDRPAPGRLTVEVARDVLDGLVPGDGELVLPTVLHEQRVDVGPADLGVPEPQHRRRHRGLRPSLDVRSVPVGEQLGHARVAWEPPNPVGAVRHDRRRCRPDGIDVGYVCPGRGGSWAAGAPRRS